MIHTKCKLLALALAGILATAAPARADESRLGSFAPIQKCFVVTGVRGSWREVGRFQSARIACHKAFELITGYKWPYEDVKITMVNGGAYEMTVSASISMTGSTKVVETAAQAFELQTSKHGEFTTKDSFATCHEAIEAACRLLEAGHFSSMRIVSHPVKTTWK